MNTQLREAIANTQIELDTAQPTTLNGVLRCIDPYLALETGYSLRVLAYSNEAVFLSIDVNNSDHIMYYILPCKTENKTKLSFEYSDAGYFYCANENFTLVPRKNEMLELQYKLEVIAVCTTLEVANYLLNQLQ